MISRAPLPLNDSIRMGTLPDSTRCGWCGRCGAGYIPDGVNVPLCTSGRLDGYGCLWGDRDFEQVMSDALCHVFCLHNIADDDTYVKRLKRHTLTLIVPQLCGFIGDLYSMDPLPRYMAVLQSNVQKYLDSQHGPQSLLSRLWRSAIVVGQRLVLPADVASLLAESHRDGYHCGLWHLAVQYEQLMAMAMLTNSDPRCCFGYGVPKTFSAWPRRHNVSLYRRAAALRERLSPTDAADRSRYLSMMQSWHQSIRYVSRVSGDTWLDIDQLKELIKVLGL